MATIPAFHVSSKSKAVGSGKVFIQSRADAVSSGTFKIKIDVSFDPSVDSYPTGAVAISCDLSDSTKTVYKSTSIELINSYGKHNPTIYLTGRCKPADASAPQSLRYWVMIASNTIDGSGTLDIAGFVINDSKGNRIAYGTGPLDGNIDVLAT